jgi:hypothetical protein
MMLAERLLQVFHWPAHHQIRLLLPGMILLSLVFHAAGLYLIRGTPPTRELALPPQPVHVSMLPGREGGGVVLDARDPSWIEPGRFRDRLIPVTLPQREWRALEPRHPSLVAPAMEEIPQAWTPPLPPLAQVPRFEPRAKPAPARLAPLVARFEEGGPEVTADVLGRLRTAAPAQPPGAATELLVVLDGSGVARHIWLLRSCGVPAVDANARRAVQLARFGPSPEGYRGILRVNWGQAEAVAP